MSMRRYKEIKDRMASLSGGSTENRSMGYNIPLKDASSLDITKRGMSKFAYACKLIIKHHPNEQIKGLALKYISQGGRTQGYEKGCAILLLQHLQNSKGGPWENSTVAKLALYEIADLI